MNLQNEFERIVNKYIKREGISGLMSWLSGTDFYSAPASTRYHGAFEGGLVMHSLNVFTSLTQLAELYGLGPEDTGCPDVDESIAIVSLFHDVCKADFYVTEMRWRKDKNNQWEQYPTWKVDEFYAFGGHGSKSVYLVQNFLKLGLEEASAINCHMGAWDKSDYGNVSLVFERNKLAWLLHVADEAATYLLDNNKLLTGGNNNE